MSLVRVTFFGDSICVGQGISLFRGWVPRIARYLDDLVEPMSAEVLVTNASVNGRTTRQALEDMPYQIQSHGVDILLIQFGLNDCNYWVTDKGIPRVSIGAFEQNLLEIIERGRRSGARYILLNNNHPTARAKEIMPYTSITFEDSNSEYNEAVRRVANQCKDDVYFTDIAASFGLRINEKDSIENYLLSDGLHLNQEGHNVYYDLMRRLIEERVRVFLRRD
jgi:acyl-CoA thioesterase-1